MKKSILVLLCSFCFVACSKDINEVNSNQAITTDTEKAFTNLNSQLEDYNRTYQFDVQTRKGFWGRFLWIVGGDALGALVGSAFGGAGAIVGGVLNSLLCAATGPPQSQQYQSINDINITLVDGQIGQIHNLIIRDMLRDDPMLLSKKIDCKKTSSIIQQKMIAYGYMISASNNLRIIDKLEQVRPTTFPNSVEESFLLYKKIIPERTKEIDIIYNFASHAVQLSDSEALKKYSNGYINIIKESNIPIASVNDIQSSIAVAANSSVLWVAK